MEEKQTKPHESLARKHQHSVESIITLLEWLLVAFILALLFQLFAMQAFQIPTGSMAETLRGAHYQLRCPRCGYSFDVGDGSVSYQQPQCSNCDFFVPIKLIGRVRNGDRIFVLKSIYQFFEPKRWDVVVFKNPTGPKDNYIKRLIGLPGESVQLINGDVFINGRIARKPANVQRELWMPIFLQDHQPLESSDHFNALIEHGDDSQNVYWSLPFVNEPNSAWDLQGNTVFSLHAPPEQEHSFVYVPSNPNDFHAYFSYNESSGYSFRPTVSDLMVNFFAKCDDSDGFIAATLEKYDVLYTARVEFQGVLTLSKTVDGVTTPLRTSTPPGPIEIGRFEKFEFANVDQQLVLRWGNRRFTYDLSKDEQFTPQDAQYEGTPTVQISASGKMQIKHLGLYRDTFYMGREAGSIRATLEVPFTLSGDEFFVCGDNSNDSLDGRLWSGKGIGNNGQAYRAGAVPRDYMMGKAVMIYWSQAFPLDQRSPSIVPNFNNLKVIYGGSQTEY